MKGKNGGVVKRHTVLLLILSVCMTCLCAGCGEETKNIVFQDPLVERCVRDELEKSFDDPITNKDLRYFRARGVRQEGDLDVSPLAGLKNLQYVLVRNASGRLRGLKT